jgi:preprotein translocase subunit SecF
MEADSLFLVAMLTIAEFSVQDTVVIFDRVRENLQLTPDRPINELVDDSVRQTLSRSINTVTTVLLTLTTLFIFGGETLRNFALTLIIGFSLGAYSSIFVASPLLAWWRSRRSIDRHPQQS